uniref:Importin subunit alpha n=1 Tax=Sinocyclocheilus anshuiensis TaxID=1608454 RepID=A0A671P2G3_9TELE
MPTENLINLSKFKNKGKEPTVSCCVELRIAQRVESILKRRNIYSVGDEEPLSPEYNTDNEQVTSATIQEIDANVNSDCPEKQRQGCQAARKLLSWERNRPLKEIVEAALLTHFVEFLGRHDDPTLQFEAAWSHANVASGTSWHTQQVVEHGAVPAFIALLASPMLNISEQAVWALGNIAGDCPSYRDALIECGVIPALLALLMLDAPVGYLCNLAWTLSNLCSNKNPFPRFRPNVWIDVVIKTGIVPWLVELLGFEELAVVTPALRSIGNIVSGSDLQTQAAIDSSVQKEAAWVVSNIAAGPCQQIQQLITLFVWPGSMTLWDTLFVPLQTVLQGDFKTRREAVWAVTNYTSGGTVDQVVHLVKCGALEAILNLLQVKDTQTVLAAEKLGEVDKLCLLEEVGGLDQMEFLQNHENNAVHRAAQAHNEKYFSEVGVSSDFFFFVRMGRFLVKRYCNTFVCKCTLILPNLRLIDCFSMLSLAHSGW